MALYGFRWNAEFILVGTKGRKEMFPLNEETGHVVDLLTRLLNTSNDLERNQLMQYLQDNSSASAFDKLDDETKLQLLKPRSIQSPDELSDYGDMLKSALEQFNASSDPAPLYHNRNQLTLPS